MIDIEEQYDEEALYEFSKAMSEKLEQKRGEGRGGWWNDDQCGLGELLNLLHSHTAKLGTNYATMDKHQLVDIANLAMMVWYRVEHENDRQAN